MFHGAVDAQLPVYPNTDLMDGLDEWFRSRRVGAGHRLPARRRHSAGRPRD